MNQPAIAGIVHSFLAILAGFATVVLLITIMTLAIERSSAALRSRFAKGSTSFYYASLVYSTLAALAGGFVTARMSGQDSLRHLLALALAVLLMSALSALQLKGQQPIVYQFALIVLLPIGAVLGGLLRLHQAGYRW